MTLTIVQPSAQKKLFLGQSVEFRGGADPAITRVELTAGSVKLPAVKLQGGIWSVANRFDTAGAHRVVARGFSAAGAEVGTATVEVVVAPPAFTDLVPIPAGINKGLTAARQSTMLETLGKPCTLTNDCKPVTNTKVQALLVQRKVGPLSVQGLRPAVEALERIVARVKADEPELFKVLGDDGMLCCRRVRRKQGQPPSPNFSNHSWGTAIDIKIGGKLDERGNGTALFGLVLLAPFFHAERFFWGAGFKGDSEDAMHFEASDELVHEWKQKGLLG